MAHNTGTFQTAYVYVTIIFCNVFALVNLLNYTVASRHKV